MIKLLDFIKSTGLATVDVTDEGGFWEKRNVEDLAMVIGRWNELVAAAIGAFRDSMPTGLLEAPITEASPNFEHLEAKGRDRICPPFAASSGRNAKTEGQQTMQLQLQHSKPGSRSSAPATDQAYLADIVRRLSFPRAYGTAANVKAETLIADEFLRMFGACARVGNTRNVCFGWPAEARILIGAHFDSVPNTPGADDNASAVAVMLAAAKALGARKDVIYVAFNAEECNLAGSQEFVKELAGELKVLEQVHVLEMVGYRDRRPNSQKNPLPMIQSPTTADFLGVVANKDYLVNQIIDAAGGISVPVVGLAIPPGLPLDAIRQLSPHLLRSDHAPFWQKNIPAVMWTDTSEFRNPNYHQPTDTPDTLDYEFMSEIGKVADFGRDARRWYRLQENRSNNDSCSP